jgi:RNA-binding protein YlmH
MTVASQRLDVLLAAVFNLSRSEASQQISSGRVLVNHSQVKSPDKMVLAGNIVTLQGSGRFTLGCQLGSTRKGRLRVEIFCPKK